MSKALIIHLAFLLTFTLRAADDHAPKPLPNPADDKVTLRGVLQEVRKARIVADGAAAVLKLKGERGAPKDAAKAILLFADGKLAEQLKTLAEENARVEITGTLRRNGVAVATIEEGGDRKERRERKEEKRKRDPNVVPQPPEPVIDAQF